MLKGLDFVMLIVPDVDQAVTFYHENLGLVPDAASAQPGTFVQFQPTPGGAIFAVAKHDGGTPYAGVELWWNTDNVDGLYDRLAARGVEVVEPLTDKPFGRTLTIKDPAGHTVYFYQPRG